MDRQSHKVVPHTLTSHHGIIPSIHHAVINNCETTRIKSWNETENTYKWPYNEHWWLGYPK